MPPAPRIISGHAQRSRHDVHGRSTARRLEHRRGRGLAVRDRRRPHTLLLFVAQRRRGLSRLYTATRTSSSAELANVQLLSNVNAGNYDHLPRLSADELTLLFTSARSGSPGAASLWTATRSNTSSSFGSPSLLPGVNDDALNEAGGLSADGLTLYFDSTRPGLGSHDLWQATRVNASAAFGNVAPLGTLSTSDDEYNVSLSRDELELVFTSNRNGSATYRLYRSLRSCP